MRKSSILIQFPCCYCLVLYYQYWSIYSIDFRPKQVFTYCNRAEDPISEPKQVAGYVKWIVVLDGIHMHFSVTLKFNLLESFIFQKRVLITGGVSKIQLQKTTNLFIRNWESLILFCDSFEIHAYSEESLHG